MRFRLKWVLGLSAVVVLLTCFFLGVMQAAADRDKQLDAQRRELCAKANWPKPTVCAYLAWQQQKKEKKHGQ